jgi:hypothetical protein
MRQNAGLLTQHVSINNMPIFGITKVSFVPGLDTWKRYSLMYSWRWAYCWSKHVESINQHFVASSWFLVYIITTTYAWKSNKYTNYSFNLLIMYDSSYITLPFSGSVRSAFWEMFNWGAVDRIVWMGVLCLVTWCVAIWDHHAPPHSFPQIPHSMLKSNSAVDKNHIKPTKEKVRIHDNINDNV